jgi:hypothetical protein
MLVGVTPPMQPLCCSHCMCRRGLFTSHDPHQLESLCAQLLQLPEVSVIRYLLQYVYMAVSRPSGPLERAITQLCSRSFNMAVQVGNGHVPVYLCVYPKSLRLPCGSCSFPGPTAGVVLQQRRVLNLQHC